MYSIGIGTNINPRTNICMIFRRLFIISSIIHISRIIETEPVGIESKNIFLNCCACIYSNYDYRELKYQLNGIEEQLGRDRNDKSRKIKDRPADIDILFYIPKGTSFISADKIPQASYVRPILVELLSFLGIRCGIPTVLAPSGTEVRINGKLVGKKPVTIEIQ